MPRVKPGAAVAGLLACGAALGVADALSRPAAGPVDALEGRVGDAEQVALTVERRGGSPEPTSEPVVVVVVVDLQRA
jgi:hypothetical protein